MGKSCLSHYKQDRLIEHFVSGSTSLTAARLCGVNRKTSSYFFLRLREIIALELEVESEAMFGGEIEVDESYFGGRCKGRRDRGAGGKIPVFGLLKQSGNPAITVPSVPSRQFDHVPISRSSSARPLGRCLCVDRCWPGMGKTQRSDTFILPGN